MAFGVSFQAATISPTDRPSKYFAEHRFLTLGQGIEDGRDLFRARSLRHRSAPHRCCRSARSRVVLVGTASAAAGGDVARRCRRCPAARPGTSLGVGRNDEHGARPSARSPGRSPPFGLAVRRSATGRSGKDRRRFRGTMPPRPARRPRGRHGAALPPVARGSGSPCCKLGPWRVVVRKVIARPRQESFGESCGNLYSIRPAPGGRHHAFVDIAAGRLKPD